MSSLTPFGFSPRRRSIDSNDRSEKVIIQRPLHRVLAFTRRTLDDVINDPIAKREVLGYFKLQNWVKDTGQRIVIVDFAHNEAGIAAVLDVSEGASRTLLFEAKRRLQDLLWSGGAARATS